MNEKQKLVVFLDMLGRTILGCRNEKKTTGEHLVISNPAVLNIMPTSNNSMQVQIIPLIFPELQAARNEGTEWYYVRANITEPSDFELDVKIGAQYANIFNPQPVAPVAPAPAPQAKNVVKLFDEPESK